MEMLIREATSEDAALIAELTRHSWANKVASNSSGHREAADHVIEDLQHGGAFILLRGDTPAGSVRWLPLDSDFDVWEIRRMGICPDFRGERLSQHLMEALIHRAQAADVRELRLAVRVDQAQLVDLYAAFGFEIAPELEYTRANPDDAPPIVMRRVMRH
ncbi:GNAT family N-acetyltransferase [Herbaspirillum robiniae]|uniref:GNAT family N-acetyltransferase n=1 Tax=Herbaspirillum robiniae TaxID=2014887 RepID=A0A246WVY7_9BURK|nr:GNAT family N-acetyltransferase [Herbaspirillum robiniae]NUU00845.1 GNAT family N-acetyltransferase [Herbaspirillum robiniae]OWY31213.1 GNAT family N-acetyltransferase [Herbaspirillum robiniae]